MCPPSASPALSGASRLTGAPGTSAPSVVSSRVSGMISTVKPVSSSAVTVWQQPSTATLPPSARRGRTRSESTVRRTTASCARASLTRPTSSTIPVNTVGNPPAHHAVTSQPPDTDPGQTRRRARLERHAFRPIHTFAENQRRHEELHLVGQLLAEHAAGEPAAALDEHV